MVHLPSGQRVVLLQLEAGWARASCDESQHSLGGGEFVSFPFLIPVMAAIWGWPASHRDSGSQWPALLMDLLPVGLEVYCCLTEQETSSGPGVCRAETLPQAESSLSAAEKAGKGTWVKITGLSRAEAGCPWP